jgi:hypothetical protein
MQPDPSILALAGIMEARGLTAPDKHDITLVKFGQRVRIAETGELPDKRVQTIAGETTVAKVERMIRKLPADHGLGLVYLIVGTDFGSHDFMTFLSDYAKRKGFSFATMIGPRSTRAIFDGFMEVLGDTATAGVC